MTDLETLVLILKYLLGPGSGLAVKWVVDKLKEEFNPSPKTTRRLTYLVSGLVPTVVYLLLAWLTGAYEPATHILAIFAAFGISQVWHGEQSLPSGKEVKAGQ